jgi:hypothetical protein
MKRTLIALTTVALAAGCTSAASSPKHSTSTPPSHAHSQPLVVHHPTPHHPTVVITEKDRGHVVRVHRGDHVVLRLHSTYWDVTMPDGHVLGAVVDTAVPTRGELPPSCVPGGGCGTVRFEFYAAHTGRVTLRAHRNSCGEAMRCTRAASRFAVQVVVT